MRNFNCENNNNDSEVTFAGNDFPLLKGTEATYDSCVPTFGLRVKSKTRGHKPEEELTSQRTMRGIPHLKQCTRNRSFRLRLSSISWFCFDSFSRFRDCLREEMCCRVTWDGWQEDVSGDRHEMTKEIHGYCSSLPTTFTLTLDVSFRSSFTSSLPFFSSLEEYQDMFTLIHVLWWWHEASFGCKKRTCDTQNKHASRVSLEIEMFVIIK